MIANLDSVRVRGTGGGEPEVWKGGGTEEGVKGPRWKKAHSAVNLPKMGRETVRVAGRRVQSWDDTAENITSGVKANIRFSLGNET